VVTSCWAARSRQRDCCWSNNRCRPGRESLSWGDFDADSELLELPLDGSTGRRADAPIYLVCAHSKHDVCCAIRGRPVANALGAVAPGRVWECTHVGGERFAANVLVLPIGLLYGRVLPLAIEEFVAAGDQGEVVAALLRGRVGFPAAAQAAMAFAYDHLAVRRALDIEFVAADPVQDGRTAVRLRGPQGLLEVTVLVERRAVLGLTCANQRPGHYIAFRPISATALSA
jgi:hypothetical protein